MFIQRILILIAIILFVLFAFSFGAIPEQENYTGLVLYKSDFMLSARWDFLWFCLLVVIQLFYLKFRRKK